MERSAWTDERLSDAIARIDQRFDSVDRRFDVIDRRFDRVESELRDIRGELIGLQRQFAQAGWALAGAVFVQLIAIVVTAALS
jgi:tetrahydromethanopterin S-methyltransferase subunit G